MRSIDEVKRQVRALLKTAGDSGATQGEIDNAVRFAAHLMNKHHLEEDDLATEPEDQYADIESAEKGERKSWVGGALFFWEKQLAYFIRDFVGGIKCYWDFKQPLRRNGIAELDRKGCVKRARGIVWYGIAEDAQIACELYDELRLIIISTCRLKWGHPYRNEGGSYCEGFVDGLREQLKKQREAERLEAQKLSDSRSLILISRRDELIKRKRREAVNYAKSQGWSFRTARGTSGASYHATANSEGRADGRATSVSAQRNPKLN